MCLYPKLINNKKYLPNKKNGGIPPTAKDERVKLVPVGCGRCEVCLKKKSREWQIRLSEEIKENNNKYFVTLTFSNEALIKLMNRYKITESNAIASIAVRLFTENWRKKYKKTIRHWLCTELGHEGTERIHMHGILFTDKTEDDIKEKWIYGIAHFGEYVNERSVNYIIKYITKVDREHKKFIPKVLCSNGIGKIYIESGNIQSNKFKGETTNEAYRLPDGHESSLPIYYRNKIYSEITRERLWINKLDKGVRWLNGKKYFINDKKEEQRFLKDLEYHQNQNKIKGYGDDTDEWKKQNYNVTINMLRRAKREKEHFRKIQL